VKIVFLGSGEFGLPTLQRLADEHRLAAIVTQPDRPAGRGRVISPTPVAAWRERNAPGVELIRASSVNEPSVTERVRSFRADALVVIAFGQKLGPDLLTDQFAINLHASLLPRWRGAAPINHAVLAGDTETGNSVITIAQRMDAGDILGRSRRPISPEQTAGDLHDLLSADGPSLVMDVLRAAESGRLTPEPQNEMSVTLAPKLSRGDGWVDFRETAEHCRRRIHGLNPWPAATVRFGDEPMKLLRAKVLAPHGQEAHAGHGPGTLLDAAEGIVACGGGTTLQITQVQPAGRRAMEWREMMRGRRIERDVLLMGGKEQSTP